MRPNITACLLTGAVALGCASVPEPPAGIACPLAADSGTGEVSVEIDAFSGRPNPIFGLTSTESDSVRAKLVGLPTIRVGGAIDPIKLGYRGFVLRGDSTAVFPGYLYVAYGMVVPGDQSGLAPWERLVYRDERGLQAFLVARARACGHGEVVG